MSQGWIPPEKTTTRPIESDPDIPEGAKCGSCTNRLPLTGYCLKEMKEVAKSRNACKLYVMKK